MTKEYVVNAPPTRAVPLDGYDKGLYGPALQRGYVVEAKSAKDALRTVTAYRDGQQWASDLALAGRLNTFGEG